jgi:HEAT repeat protein
MSAVRSSLGKALAELTEGGDQISRRSLHEFSDLDPASLQLVLQAWPAVPAKRKRILLDGLRNLAEESTLVSFDDLARSLLADPEPAVRTRAIRLLFETRDSKLVPSFIRLLSDDADAETRAEAASALGAYVELGELEEIPAALKHEIEDALLEKANSDDQLTVRRNALESLGFSSRLEVMTLIESAFRRENPDWQASALFAMGRSSDERWEENVLSRLEDVNRIVRLAAVEAAGELRLAAARLPLFKLLEDEDEEEISSAAIWSLSQIGGEDARLFIQNLLDLAEDDEDAEFLEDALDNLQFTDELSNFDLMAIQTDEEDGDFGQIGESKPLQ